MYRLEGQFVAKARWKRVRHVVLLVDDAKAKVFPMVSPYEYDFTAKAAQGRKKCQHGPNMPRSDLDLEASWPPLMHAKQYYNANTKCSGI